MRMFSMQKGWSGQEQRSTPVSLPLSSRLALVCGHGLEATLPVPAMVPRPPGRLSLLVLGVEDALGLAAVRQLEADGHQVTAAHVALSGSIKG
jgi:hypothetical protein